jgi:hypothetical protein
MERLFAGYEHLISVYSHISGDNYDKGADFFSDILWDNRVEVRGGTASLVVAEGLVYKAALKYRIYFCRFRQRSHSCYGM